MKHVLAICTLVAALSIGPAIPVAAATTPANVSVANAIQVVDTGRNGDFSYAIVRDGTMRGHNNYCVTVGAHIGKLFVVEIRNDGVLLSNGWFLPKANYAIARTNFD